ncbi:MAG: hypothetical protein Q8K57_07080 [Thiobacillus sp.]|nr:hypothetical protein [Gammaproteobacteria bacterium]MDO9007579.1 hypothetical protein [Thiobacillus sp.]MDP1924530.1 hypothetical protein [Thiobacillus sp.]MDP3124318.1 hypothetical protein [Thiobacillus sp.]
MIDPAHLVKKGVLPITPSHQHTDSQQVGVTHPEDSIMNKAKTAVPLKVIGRKVLERWHKSNENS